MKYTPRNGRDDALAETLEPVLKGLGLCLVEATASRHKGGCQVRLILTKPDGIGTEECSRAHKAVVPRLELLLETRGFSLEVSSPGIARQIKDASEFACFTGRGLRCFVTDQAGWIAGTILAADEKAVTLEGEGGQVTLAYERIGKARLDAEYDRADHTKQGGEKSGH
ncbi:MAG: ribosome assembly cofactor RimP [Treponema sp.]|jgi:ribosome maturation factor RimP|nr:ribosome assembly cofactor RimP [Treponema sp.]